MLGVAECLFTSNPRGGDELASTPAPGLTKGEGIAGRWAGLVTCCGRYEGGIEARAKGEEVVLRLVGPDIVLRLSFRVDCTGTDMRDGACGES
jgi:hypothetical protein